MPRNKRANNAAGLKNIRVDKQMVRSKFTQINIILLMSLFSIRIFIQIINVQL